MQCQTVQPGTECTFWKKQGCTFKDNSCQTTVEQCEGCANIVESSIGKVCNLAPEPAAKWNNTMAICNFATHKKVELKIEKQRVNPLKASKKSAGK